MSRRTRDGADLNQPRNDSNRIANVTAEAAVLSAMMLKNDVIDHAAARLVPDDFSDIVNRKLFMHMVRLRRAGSVVDPVILRPIVIADPDLIEDPSEESGFVPLLRYVASLGGSQASGAVLVGFHDFIAQVRDLGVLRQVRRAADAGVQQLERMDGQTSVAETASSFASAIMQASERASPVRARSGGEMLRSVVQRQAEIEQNSDAGGVACKTIPDLTNLLGLLGPATYTMIGGRPSMGKSVLAQSLLLGTALNGHGSLMISAEMTDAALAMRLAADATHAMDEPVSYRAIQRGTMTRQELLTMEAAAEKLDRLPLRVVNPGRSTIEAIEGMVAMEAAAMKRRGQVLRVVAIDYIQILRAMGRFASRVEELNHISARLLELFKRYELAGIVMSQLSRDIDKRPDKRPVMSDLRESGQLEQDADNILFVNRAERWLKMEEPKQDSKEYEAWFASWQAARDKVSLIAPKVRSGETGSVDVKFFGDSQAVRGKAYKESWGDMDDRDPLL